jgi:BirA family biotin operon repressor/biotin-[acetyl-CoA-carboxylase] ligase
MDTSTLQALLPGVWVEHRAHTDSTSTRLVERLRAGDTRPGLLVADAQSGGRGRQGRRWQSSPGASLTFSLALPLAPRDWAGLSLAVGVALADALDPAPAPAIMLKWPNDLWLPDGAAGGGRKLGGVLIETVTVAARRWVVAGVGLNLQAQPTKGLNSGFACLQELEPGAAMPVVLQRVAPALLQALQRFEREGFAAFADGFARRDLLRGQAVSTTAADLPQGVADGVDADGALRLRVDGVIQRLLSGEVSVRLAAPERA